MTEIYLGFASFSIIAISIGLWFRAMGQVAIPKDRRIFIAAWFVAGGLGVTALLGEPGWLGGIPAGIGAAASALFLFTVSISRQQLGDDAIAVGSTIPSFTATDEHGKIFDSQSLAGQPVLIKFFRGHW